MTTIKTTQQGDDYTATLSQNGKTVSEISCSDGQWTMNNAKGQTFPTTFKKAMETYFGWKRTFGLV